MKPPGKKVSILGLGVSGYESALFLQRRGFQVFASDQGNSENLQKKAAELRKQGIETEIGGHTLSRLLESDWALISPGIAPNSSSARKISEKGIPLVSEIEVASWFCPSDQIVAVTGSSGKTTVTTLMGRVFEKLHGRSFTCGNIGNPWISEIEKIQPGDAVVVEVSSFQLNYCQTFRPKVGLLLNLSPNHQDWHPDMTDYARAKLRLFQNQKAEDAAIIRREDQQKYYPEYKFKSQIVYLEDFKAANPNEAAVRLVAQMFNVPQSVVNEVLQNFEGIEHRLEKFATREGVQFMNDSKCTTTASLAWALEKFPDHSVVLVAGGHPKSNDFANVRGLIQQKVKKAILIGEARPLLKEAWKNCTDFFETNDFQEAVKKAAQSAQAGDSVLLSPACASFDMFENYIERGKKFKWYVQEWITSQALEKKERVSS